MFIIRTLSKHWECFSVWKVFSLQNKENLTVYFCVRVCVCVSRWKVNTWTWLKSQMVVRSRGRTGPRCGACWPQTSCCSTRRDNKKRVRCENCRCPQQQEGRLKQTLHLYLIVNVWPLTSDLVSDLFVFRRQQVRRTWFICAALWSSGRRRSRAGKTSSR